MIQKGKALKSQQEDKKQKDSSLKITHGHACLLKSEETHTQPCISGRKFPAGLHGWSSSKYGHASSFVFFFFSAPFNFLCEQFFVWKGAFYLEHLREN